jgi:hypothetical protein
LQRLDELWLVVGACSADANHIIQHQARVRSLTCVGGTWPRTGAVENCSTHLTATAEGRAVSVR